MRKMMLGLVMVVMMFAMVGCGEETKKGFVPEQVTQTPSGNTEEVLDEEIKEDIEGVTNGDLTQYYDVEKFVGTPTVKNMIYLYISSKDAYCFVDKVDFFSGNLFIEHDERLEVGKTYECIVCDNDTPDNTRDDVIAYIFME